jgi:hypothetical protein
LHHDLVISPTGFLPSSLALFITCLFYSATLPKLERWQRLLGHDD